MNAVLDKWKEKLLDLGKRNRLLNFKDVKSSVITIYESDQDKFFNKLLSGGRLDFFDLDSYISNNFKAGKPVNLGGFDYENCEETLSKISSTLKPKQILGYNNDVLKPTLKNLLKKSNVFLIENGINILYAAFGFLKWSDNIKSSASYLAPLILLPIKISNDLHKNTFSLELYENEIVINPTLKYKLSTEFGIELPIFEDKTSIFDYQTSVEALCKERGFSIENSIKIGMFSFLKMNMYLDIKENESTILSNSNVRKLLNIDDGSKQVAEKLEFNDLEPKNFELLHSVVDADSSQMGAILDAKKRKSFVLQGPPGTGKSQTITNIIAECLLDGRKVLFVSEKLAALQVVYNNLKKVNLSDFCLELHSHKTSRGEVIAELNRTLRLKKTAVSATAEGEILKLRQAKYKLDDYRKILHENQETLGISIFELYNKVAQYENALQIDYRINDINSKSNDYLNECIIGLKNYIEYSESIGYDFRKNAWNGFTCSDISAERRNELKEIIKITLDSFHSLSNYSQEIKSTLNIFIDDIAMTKEAIKVFDNIIAEKYYVPEFFSKKDLIENTRQIFELYKLQTDIRKAIEELNVHFENSVFTADIDEIFESYKNVYSSPFKRVFNKGYKKARGKMAMFQKKLGKKYPYIKMLHFLKLIRDTKNSQIQYIKKADIYKQILKDGYDGLNTPWDKYLVFLDKVKNFYEAGIDVSIFVEIPKEHLQRDMLANYSAELKNLVSKINIGSVFLQGLFDKDVFNISESSHDAVAKKLQHIENDFDLLNNWIGFFEVLKKLRKLKIDEYLEKALDQGIELKYICDVYKKLFYNAWLDSVFTNNTNIKGFTRIAQDNIVNEFCEKDRLQFEIDKAVINEKLSAKRPNIDTIIAGSLVAKLVREGEKKRRQMPVRMLINEMSGLVSELKPCFLMSPLSVSTYLDGAKVKFDVVIFDEASQIFPEDAIGAIYRARQVIVVGDSKQMPPTNFFNTVTEVDESEGNYDDDVNDFESILDICNCSLPSNCLKWHYRSRFEELIAFSNKNFYDDSLVTFPSAKKPCKDSGVEFYYTQDGVFSRSSKTNVKEAEYICDLVFEHFKSNGNKSLGVVAFSKSQQDEIERVIEKRRIANPKFEKYFNGDLPQPFFVKNLETVQGDERDTIIFSVGYAKDNDGKFYHNFGPLNRSGGERRLNVAITRAKTNVKLVSSIRGSDINLSRTKAEGARLLKEYLEYAESGSINIIQSGDASQMEKRQFIKSVAEFLKESGFDVDTFVGYSEYKIDIAIKNSNSNDYLLAIECDGFNYKNANTTRDRDRLRQENLQRMGWQFYRLWSTEWFRNNRAEKERLINTIDRLLSAKPNKVEKVDFLKEKNDFKSFISDPVFLPNKKIIKEYEYADIDRLTKLHHSEYHTAKDDENFLRAILHIEAPIAIEYLLKRIVHIYNFTRVTKGVEDAFRTTMKRVYDYEIRDDGFVYAKNCNFVPFRMASQGNPPRDIKYVCDNELMTGIVEMVKQNITVTRNGLYKALCNQLGMSRTTETATQIFDRLLKALNENGILDITDDFVALKK